MAQRPHRYHWLLVFAPVPSGHPRSGRGTVETVDVTASHSAGVRFAFRARTTGTDRIVELARCCADDGKPTRRSWTRVEPSLSGGPGGGHRPSSAGDHGERKREQPPACSTPGCRSGVITRPVPSQDPRERKAGFDPRPSPWQGVSIGPLRELVRRRVPPPIVSPSGPIKFVLVVERSTNRFAVQSHRETAARIPWSTNRGKTRWSCLDQLWLLWNHGASRVRASRGARAARNDAGAPQRCGEPG